MSDRTGPDIDLAAAPDTPAAAQDIVAVRHQTSDSGQGAVAVLRELLVEERRKSDSVLEASLVWQTRALQLQERLAALEAGPLTSQESAESADAAQDANRAPLRDETREMDIYLEPGARCTAAGR